MAPSHIFIVRHSERVDHVNPTFAKTYARPHDSPITEKGIAMAECLGTYLVSHHHLDPTQLVILSSPLLRCVQTSHGIVTGVLQAATPRSTVTSVPIYLEPAIMEGPSWLLHDMRANPAVVEPGTGEIHVPVPIYRDEAFHRASTSPHVQLSNPFPLHPAPVFSVEKGDLVDRSFPDRCALGARTLLTIPQLDGKTVILVGHGETALRVLQALKADGQPTQIPCPAYTSFAHVTCEGSGPTTRVTVASEPFATPHLPNTPSET